MTHHQVQPYRGNYLHGLSCTFALGCKDIKILLAALKKQKKTSKNSLVRPSADCVVTPEFVLQSPNYLSGFMCIIKGRPVICDLTSGRQASSHLPRSYYVSASEEVVISADAPVSAACLCRSLSCIRAAGAVKAGIWHQLKAAYLMTGAPVQIRRRLE